jgi:hypothetical protein
VTGMPLKTMSMIAVMARLNGVIVHVIMISRVLYGLAAQGNLAKDLAQLNTRTGTPLLATALGIVAILVLALAVPLSGLADLIARFTLVVFAIINTTLIRIKSREELAPLHLPESCCNLRESLESVMDLWEARIHNRLWEIDRLGKALFRTESILIGLKPQKALTEEMLNVISCRPRIGVGQFPRAISGIHHVDHPYHPQEARNRSHD